MRVDGWEMALIDVIAAADTTPFSWANSGCIELAIDNVTALTGSSPLEKPVLEDALDARRWLKANGFDSLGDAMAAYLEEIPVAMAGRGDLGVVIREGIETAAVSDGLHWVAKSETGLLRVLRGDIARAFKV